MSFRRLHDRVVVKRIDAEEKSAGGIKLKRSRRRARSSPSAREAVTRQAT